MSCEVDVSDFNTFFSHIKNITLTLMGRISCHKTPCFEWKMPRFGPPMAIGCPHDNQTISLRQGRERILTCEKFDVSAQNAKITYLMRLYIYI